MTPSLLRLTLPLCSALLILASSTFAAEDITPAPAFTTEQLTALPETGWLTNGGNLSNQRYSPLTQINRDNVANLKAVFRLCRAVMRPMMKQRFGRIINITSVVGASGNPGQANYAAAKAGVAGMTRALAKELGSRGITVNCVAPGFIDTDMTAGLPEEQQKALLAQIPLGHLGQPDDVAQAVAFLAGSGAAYITGQELHVNGGMYMA
jgi:NAD(P)-dependent dehydrogenase (short-subunit alcohol dehydrogenase family)